MLIRYPEPALAPKPARSRAAGGTRLPTLPWSTRAVVLDVVLVRPVSVPRNRWFVSLRPTRSAQALSVRAPALLAHFVTWSLRQATAHAPTSGPPKEAYVRDPPRRSALPAPAPVGVEGAHSAGRDHPAGRARWWGQEHVGLLAGCALEPRPAHGQARARASRALRGRPVGGHAATPAGRGRRA